MSDGIDQGPFWLDTHGIRFPDTAHAQEELSGLLALGGDLSTPRLLAAYRKGIFPWYNDDRPILWWSPDPRCVIAPSSFTPGRSLTKRLRKRDYVVTCDRDFHGVINACRTRGNDERTWITREMMSAYIELHHAGYAHSIECYMDNVLAGGLYGVAIGRIFFGESMFHRRTDASKIAFAELMACLRANHCPLVDCQVANSHLFSLGAYEISRQEFEQVLAENIGKPPIDWRSFARPGQAHE